MTRLKLFSAKLKLWFLIRWYGMDTIERGLQRMAKATVHTPDGTVYVLDGATVTARTRTYTLEVEERER